MKWSGVNREKVKILRLFCESLLFEKQCMTFRGNANTFFMASYFHIFSTQFILFPSLMKMIYFYAIVIVFPLSNLLYFSDLSCFNGAFEIQDDSKQNVNKSDFNICFANCNSFIGAYATSLIVQMVTAFVQKFQHQQVKLERYI